MVLSLASPSSVPPPAPLSAIAHRKAWHLQGGECQEATFLPFLGRLHTPNAPRGGAWEGAISSTPPLRAFSFALHLLGLQHPEGTAVWSAWHIAPLRQIPGTTHHPVVEGETDQGAPVRGHAHLSPHQP